MHAGDINDKLLTATQAGEVTVVGEFELALLQLGVGPGSDLSPLPFSNFFQRNAI